MLSLYHMSLSPFSRKVRLALAEKDLSFTLMEEREWERRADFLALNPAGTVPVLVDGDTVVCDSGAILEYLEEAYPGRTLIPGSPAERAEARRLAAWFDGKFHQEVGELLIGEKLTKRLVGGGQPSSAAIRAGLANIRYHLDYIAYLSERRTWLAGDHLSIADLAAAAHLSVVDYIGDVPWAANADAKEWYARMKSRPAFRALLADSLPGIPPPAYYADLDF